MQVFERVLIVTDNKSFMTADALRAVLQEFNLTVHLHRLVQYRQAAEFFAGDFGASYPYLILCAHGMGSTPETMRIELQVVDQKDGDYSARDGWDWKAYEIRPENVPQLFGSYRGHVIAMACGGGREAFGQAFLDAGCRSYTGFDLGTAEGSNWRAFVVFTINLFYHLLSESACGDGRKRTMADAVRLAAATDTGYRHGTGAYRIHERGTRMDEGTSAGR